ncbi:ubiquitin-protein transferase activity protein [Homalodisca vitripennis]|nr:ubiquitin-protein transferase activity protein [Homalodisca vitripennis]
MARHPCGICKVHVLDTDEAIQCDGQCSLWHHRECLGMTLDVYLKLSKGQEDWVCRKCKKLTREIKQEVDPADRRRHKEPDMGKTKVECKKLETLTGTQKCVFCHTQDIDELKYGPIYMHKNIITHYYCLLLSSNMGQNGRDCDGILGFLPNDINKEVRRGMRLYCSFCREGGATLGCDISRCKVVFHLPCGMKHGTLHQFFGEFKSFCAKHRPVQRISEKILAESSKGAMCGICYEKVIPRPIHETLWAPCCQKSAFFHRDCVQKLATSAGYFFKCPLCNNKDVFQQSMKEFGIYIPEQNHQRVQLAATNRMDWPARRCHTTAAAARHGWRIVADKQLRCHI